MTVKKPKRDSWPASFRNILNGTWSMSCAPKKPWAGALSKRCRKPLATPILALASNAASVATPRRTKSAVPYLPWRRKAELSCWRSITFCPRGPNPNSVFWHKLSNWVSTKRTCSLSHPTRAVSWRPVWRERCVWKAFRMSPRTGPFTGIIWQTTISIKPMRRCWRRGWIWKRPTELSMGRTMARMRTMRRMPLRSSSMPIWSFWKRNRTCLIHKIMS
mmetsp:Transcript_2337/g.4738  ORF Transcript_2337/g.4738 Transcript_2337/m.4738 type:complete len:218 (+) Transcript_2337:602-1255(+)